MPIDIEKLWKNAKIETPNRNPKGFHTLAFKDEKIKIELPNGKSVEIELASEGWKELTTFLKTNSPTVMAKRLVAIAYNANREK